TMAMSSFRVFALAAASLAASCSFPKEQLAPSFEASDPRGTTAATPQPAAPAAPQPAAPATSSSYLPSLTAPPPTDSASANPPAAPAPPTPFGAAPQTTASTVPAPRGGSAVSTIPGNAVAPGRVDALRADLRQLQADVAQHMSDLQRVKR